MMWKDLMFWNWVILYVGRISLSYPVLMTLNGKLALASDMISWLVTHALTFCSINFSYFRIKEKNMIVECEDLWPEKIVSKMMTFYP